MSQAESTVSTYYPIDLDEDVAGAGTWKGHVDRGLITGGVAGTVTYINTGSVTAAATAAAGGFAGGAGGSVYNGGASGSGNASGRVICTHFYRRGMLDRELWRADMEFTFATLPEATVRGYHYWAIPYVRLMRRSPLAERLMYPLAKARAEEIAYRMGLRPKGSFGGKIVRLVGESICFALGQVVRQKDWAGLWAKSEAKG